MTRGTEQCAQSKEPLPFLALSGSFGATTRVYLASHLTASPPSAAAAPPPMLKLKKEPVIVVSRTCPVTLRSDEKN